MKKVTVTFDERQLEILADIFHGYKDANRGVSIFIMPAMDLERHISEESNGLYKPDTTYDMEEYKQLRYNAKMSETFNGLTIYDSANEQFPYYVSEWDECYTYEEIERHWKDSLDFTNIDTEQEKA